MYFDLMNLNISCIESQNEEIFLSNGLTKLKKKSHNQSKFNQIYLIFITFFNECEKKIKWTDKITWRV